MAVEHISAVRASDTSNTAAILAARVRERAGRCLSEPLLQFFIVGLLLFAWSEHHRRDIDLYRIVVTAERVRQLSAGYRAEFGAEPGSRELSQLVEHDIDQEVLYREGIERKLDQDDEIVRRRIAQKMQFLVQDIAVPREPTAVQVAAYYREHSARYAMPATASFTHIFFSDGSGGSEAARRRAEAVLLQIPVSAGRAPERGDAFPDLYDYSDLGSEQARRVFGDSEIISRIFDAPSGSWAGPFRSDYGWHLVRVYSRTPSRLPAFAEVQSRVRDDLIVEQQESTSRHNFEALKARFTVVREARGTAQ
jgi:peptidyl-prolyl cis-trans isomerase C